MPWMPYMIAIPAIFNFIKISLDYFGKAKPQTLQVNSVTHQLELLRFRKDHQPSIRWFAGDKLYLWSFSAAYSSWCVALRIHCIAAKVTFSTILGQFSNFELCLNKALLEHLDQYWISPLQAKEFSCYTHKYNREWEIHMAWACHILRMKG